MTVDTARAPQQKRQRERRFYADAVAWTDAQTARARLWDALHAIAARTDALNLDYGLRVGPRRGRAPYKNVTARVGPVTTRDATVVVPVQWRPTGRLAGLYPTLTGSFGITAIEPSSCLVSFAGSYVPPLGRIGAAVDRSAMSRVADATARSLTGELVAALSSTTPSREHSNDAPRKSKEGRP